VYVLVAGGGKVGRNLTELLVKKGHEVLLIERMQAKVDQYNEQLGNVVVQGDACEVSVLADNGVERADVVIAVTGDDEDNLVICQLAKKKFNVQRTIARVNNPKNERIFKHLGIDATVNPTNTLVDLIEQEIPSHSLWHLMNLRDSDLQLVDAIISQHSPVFNQTIKDITLPDNSQIVLLVRGGKAQVAAPELQLKNRDEVIVLAPQKSADAVHQILVGHEEV
jgi:trk system potassium uptake protein TrkA